MVYCFPVICDMKGKIRTILRMIAGKLSVFLFCVLFISGYNALFGRENSIVGVVLLMSLLIFLKADFGMAAVYSGALIPVLLVAMGLCAKWSALHPLLGLAIDTLFLGAVLLATRQDESRSAYLPFLMGFVMLRGYDVSGDLLWKRMVSLAVIGCFIGLVHWMFNRRTCGRAGLAALTAPLSRYGAWERWAMSLLGTLIPTMLVGDLLSIPKSMWVNLTVLSLMTPVEEELIHRRRLRVPATILGCVLFLTLFGWLIPQSYQTAVILLAGFLSMFITSYFIKTAYNSFSALVTATLLLPAHTAAATRIVNNLIGAAVTVVSLFFWNRLFRRWDKSLQNS